MEVETSVALQTCTKISKGFHSRTSCTKTTSELISERTPTKLLRISLTAKWSSEVM